MNKIGGKLAWNFANQRVCHKRRLKPGDNHQTSRSDAHLYSRVGRALPATTDAATSRRDHNHARGQLSHAARATTYHSVWKFIYFISITYHNEYSK